MIDFSRFETLDEVRAINDLIKTLLVSFILYLLQICIQILTFNNSNQQIS